MFRSNLPLFIRGLNGVNQKAKTLVDSRKNWKILTVSCK